MKDKDYLFSHLSALNNAASLVKSEGGTVTARITSTPDAHNSFAGWVVILTARFGVADTAAIQRTWMAVVDCIPRVFVISKEDPCTFRLAARLSSKNIHDVLDELPARTVVQTAGYTVCSAFVRLMHGWGIRALRT